MIPLHKLEHFVVLARALNYARASDELALSQPALTRSIQSLERSLGIRLFDRSRSKVALTAAGQDLISQASDLLIRSAAVEESARSIAAGNGGRVAFGIGPVAAALLLPEILSAIDLRDVVLDIRTETPDILAEQLILGEIDFFLARFPKAGISPAIEVEWLNKTLPNGGVRREHPLAKTETIDIEALRSFRRAAAHGFREVLSRIPDARRRAAYEPHIEYDVLGTLWALAAQSDLVVFGAFNQLGPEFSVLRIPDDDAQYMVSDVALFRLEGRTLNPAARRVQAIVRRHYSTLA